MELKTYYDFAMDDYRLLKQIRDNGIMANSLGAIAQNTCERFIKHIINTYISANAGNRSELTDVMSTHNLNRLANYWNKHSEFKIDFDTIQSMKMINGFYFSTKYPGDDSQTLTEEDIDICMEAVEKCRKSVDSIIYGINKTSV